MEEDSSIKYWKILCENEKISRLRNEKLLSNLNRIEEHSNTLKQKFEKLMAAKIKYEQELEVYYPNWKNLLNDSFKESNKQIPRNKEYLLRHMNSFNSNKPNFENEILNPKRKMAESNINSNYSEILYNKEYTSLINNTPLMSKMQNISSNRVNEVYNNKSYSSLDNNTNVNKLKYSPYKVDETLQSILISRSNKKNMKDNSSNLNYFNNNQLNYSNLQENIEFDDMNKIEKDVSYLTEQNNVFNNSVNSENLGLKGLPIDRPLDSNLLPIFNNMKQLNVPIFSLQSPTHTKMNTIDKEKTIHIYEQQQQNDDANLGFYMGDKFLLNNNVETPILKQEFVKSINISDFDNPNSEDKDLNDDINIKPNKNDSYGIESTFIEDNIANIVDNFKSDVLDAVIDEPKQKHESLYNDHLTDSKFTLNDNKNIYNDDILTQNNRQKMDNKENNNLNDNNVQYSSNIDYKTTDAFNINDLKNTTDKNILLLNNENNLSISEERSENTDEDENDYIEYDDTLHHNSSTMTQTTAYRKILQTSNFSSTETENYLNINKNLSIIQPKQCDSPIIKQAESLDIVAKLLDEDISQQVDIMNMSIQKNDVNKNDDDDFWD